MGRSVGRAGARLHGSSWSGGGARKAFLRNFAPIGALHVHVVSATRGALYASIRRRHEPADVTSPAPPSASASRAIVDLIIYRAPRVPVARDLILIILRPLGRERGAAPRPRGAAQAIELLDLELHFGGRATRVCGTAAL